MSASKKTKTELIKEVEALNRRIRTLEQKKGSGAVGRAVDAVSQSSELEKKLESLKPNDHLCLLYESEAEWRATVIPFLTIGLKKGEKCIYIVDVHTAGQIRESLHACGIDVSAAERRKQLVIIHKTDAYTPDGLFDPDRMVSMLEEEAKKAIDSDYPGIRLTEEKSVRSSGYLYLERLLEYEARLNKYFFPRYQCAMICQYDRRRSDPVMIKNAIMTHPLIIRNYDVYRNFYYVSSDEFMVRRREERQVQDWLASIEQEGEAQKRVRFLSDVLERSSQPLTVSYPDGHIMFCNRAFCALTGYTEEELHSMTWAVDLTPPEEREYELNRLEELRKTEMPQRYETLCVHKNGSRVPIEVFIHQISDSEGNPKYFYTFVTDIRQRKQQRQELIERERRFESLFESSPVSLWEEDFSKVKESLDSLRESGVEDVETHLDEHPEVVERLAQKVRVLDVNETTLEMFGARNKGELEKGLSRIFLKESYDSFREELKAIEERRTSCETEVDARTLSGEKKSFIMRWTVAPGCEETFSKVIVSLVDVTETRRIQREKEEYEMRLRTILNNTVQALLLLDRKGTIQVCNATAREWGRVLFGKELAEGDRIFDYVPSEDRSVFQGRFRRALEGVPSHGDRQIAGRWVEFNYIPVRGRTGVTGVCISLLNIDERVEGRRKLEEKEAWFSTLVEYSSDVIIILSGENCISYLSSSVERVLGYKPEDLAGKDFFGLVHPRDLFPLRAALNSAVERPGILVTGDFRLRHRDGTWIWLDAVGNNLLEDARVQGIVLNVRDIRERKKTEEELEATRERFQSLLEGSSEVTVLVDKDLTITYQSPSIERVLGYKPIDRVGKRVADLIHPNDLSTVMEGFRRAIDNPEEMVRAAIRVRHKNGSWRIVEATGKNLLSNPAVNGIVINYHDITARQEAEEKLRQSETRLRSYLASAEDIIVVQDRLGKYLYYNGPRSYGLSSERVVGKYPADVHAAEIAKEIVRNVKRVVRTKEGLSSEMSLVWAGKTLWFLHRLSPVRDRAGNVSSVLTVARDITNRKLAEMAAEEARTRYEKLAESLGELVYRADAKTFAPNYVNSAVKRFYGYTKRQWLKDPELWERLIHPDDKQRVFRELRRARRRGRAVVVEYRIIRRDGTVRWVADHVAWERDEKGKPLAMDGVMHDVTQHKEAEAASAGREKVSRERASLFVDLRHLSGTDEILTRVCSAVRDSGLFERAVMTLHSPGGEIISMGHVGMPRRVVERARKAPPMDRRLRRRIMSKRFKISESFFVPAEAQLDYRATGRYVPQPKKAVRTGGWKTGDELFVPLAGFSGETMGFLSVDTPTDGCRPNVETARALEMLVDAAAGRVREVEAQRVLERERDFSRSIIETANSLIVCLDSDARIVLFNEECERVTGYRKDEVLGKHWPTLFLPPAERHPGLRSFAKWIRAHPADRYEGPIVAKNGEVRTILWSNSMIGGANQEEMLAIAIGQDITDRKRARGLLEESEQRLKELTNLLPQTIFEMDLSGKVIFTNEYGLRSFGYSQDDLDRGVDAFQLFAPEQEGVVRENMKKILSGEVSSGNEYTAVRKDGSAFPVLVYSAPIVRAGEPVGLRGVVVDISERRRMENEMARAKEYVDAIFNSVTDAIFVTDLKRRFVTCNRSTTRIFGYSKEELVGKSARLFYRDRSSFESAGRTYLSQIRKHGYAEGEVVLSRKNKSTFLGYASATLLVDAAGQAMGLVVVVRDISKRRQSGK